MIVDASIARNHSLCDFLRGMQEHRKEHAMYSYAFIILYIHTYDHVQQ